MTRIEDVARDTGLSTASVSRAMRGLPGVSPENRLTILEAAQRLGYVPSPDAAALASRRTHLVAVVVANLAHGHVAHAVQGAEEVLRDADFGVLLYTLAGGPVAAVREQLFGATGLLSKRADAVLVVGFRLTNEELGHLTEHHRPVVSIGESESSQLARLLGRRGAARVLSELRGHGLNGNGASRRPAMRDQRR